ASAVADLLYDNPLIHLYQHIAYLCKFMPSAWWLPLVWVLLALLGIVLVVASWRWVPGVLLSIVVVAAVVWVLVSVLSPAIPDRTCPRCGGEGLVKIRRGELGVRCELCDFEDPNMHVAYLDEW
ncbi:MAG: hypothetical protein AAF517_13065, partial [Planctomycetota bacterium]